MTAWEEEKTFYGPCVNFDTADARMNTVCVIFVILERFIFLFSNSLLSRDLRILQVQIGRVEWRSKDAA